jgi:glycosyltransferase involved in cell wall biosynthesis
VLKEKTIMENELVSVVIPTYNRADCIIQCVDSVLNSDYENVEVIVVDNCSTDNTLELLAKYDSVDKVRIICLKENLMAAGGRNKGFEDAKGDYIMFLDSDNIIHKDMLSKMVETFHNVNNLGFAAPVSVQINQGMHVWTLGAFINLKNSIPINNGSGKKIDDIDSSQRYYKTCYSPNCGMVSRKAYEIAGGFDEVYYIMYEEADFGYKVVQSGFEAVIDTHAITDHYSGMNSDQNDRLRKLGVDPAPRAYHFAKNRSIFMSRYAKGLDLVLFYLFWVHAFCIYYVLIALKEKRADIAKAYFKGTWKGIGMTLFHRKGN